MLLYFFAMLPDPFSMPASEEEEEEVTALSDELRGREEAPEVDEEGWEEFFTEWLRQSPEDLEDDHGWSEPFLDEVESIGVVRWEWGYSSSGFYEAVDIVFLK
ncbi:hypothetical protein MLD38_017364 [Melastoma candidum]|uniref:Uncharacterized protein n=1 Tax=Melastoma candidum TaxID=119954 RepID=A0ACB9QTH3_9MYRT|nr:hypothetical protein MLD38_017364 [Melastoma candidum]